MTDAGRDGARPRVTVGMPVYNGAAHLDEALASIRGQTLRDVEILVSDNASTDATEEICRRHAAADPRIRYVRHAENQGAMANFCWVMDEARGDYFLWAAHDDVRDPRALERLAAALDAQPGAVLATSRFQAMTPEGAPLTLGAVDWGRIFRAPRFVQMAAMIALNEERSQKAVHIYGLLRMDAIRRAMAANAHVGPYAGNDVCVLLHLLGEGDAAFVDEVLFRYRVRTPRPAALPPRPGLARHAWERLATLGGKLGEYRRAYLGPNAEYFAGIRQAVARAALPPGERMALQALATLRQASRGTRIVRDVAWSNLRRLAPRGGA